MYWLAAEDKCCSNTDLESVYSPHLPKRNADCQPLVCPGAHFRMLESEFRLIWVKNEGQMDQVKIALMQ